MIRTCTRSAVSLKESTYNGIIVKELTLASGNALITFKTRRETTANGRTRSPLRHDLIILQTNTEFSIHRSNNDEILFGESLSCWYNA